MTDLLHPAYLFLFAAVVLPLVPGRTMRAALMMIVPVISGWIIWNAAEGMHQQVSFFGFTLTLLHVDGLSRIFALAFSLIAFLAAIYAWHVHDRVQQIATMLYAGSSIGAVFAGDLITLFFYWEGTAVASVFLIWARRTEGAFHTGMRYLIIQISSGVILIVGVALHYQQTGSIAFENLGLVSTGTWLIFLAFGIKCAFPLLHNWVQDSYPAGTLTGTLILSVFTTKIAIFSLARAFPGTELLIYIGVVMTLFPIFFAEIENDLRRVLSYSLNNQLGFMVVGIGVGTPMALNGTAAHAFANILFEGLLFMTVGSVLYRTGTSKASELGGLYKTMPYTMVFCVIGAASISAFPLFSGFVSKSLILEGTATTGHWIVWIGLTIASAGVLSHAGIKIPYFTFFAHDSGKRPKEAPSHMLLAMGIMAALCIIIGVFPQMFYSLLPFEVDYQPYTTSHVIAQLQLLLFALLAFAFLMRSGVYPPELRAINLEFDWTYRKLAPRIIAAIAKAITAIWGRTTRFAMRRVHGIITRLYRTHGPEGYIARVWPTGSMVLWIAVLLGATLLVSFVDLYQ